MGCCNRKFQLRIYIYIYRYIYIVKLVTFPCGIEFCVLMVTQNVIIFIIADIHKQERTAGEFLNTH